MVRRVGEPVAVRTAAEQPGVGPAPVAVEAAEAPATFLWRGRLYVVREVLGHWRERRAWWTAAAARAVRGEDEGEDRVQGGSGERYDGDDPYGGAATGEETGREVRLAPGPRVPLDHEREVWRVEASPGRTFGSGVYDLSRETPGPGAAPPGAWQLLRVSD
jgi:Family of unknown function (DUF6504)